MVKELTVAMEAKKKHRKVLRASFTKVANELDNLLQVEKPVHCDVEISWECLKGKFDELRVCEQQVYEALLENATEEQLMSEMDSSDAYQRRFINLRLRCSKVLQPGQRTALKVDDMVPVVSGSSQQGETEKRTKEEMANAAKDLFLQTVTVNMEGRYEVRLPWIEGHPPLPTNYSVARKRVGATMHKLERVAPLKKLTIPRLELMGATIAARLYKQVTDNLKSSFDSFFWCDSSTVITWIRNHEEWGIFVWNRVNEIRRLTPTIQWRHIPGSDNPADLPSRGCSPKQLLESKWWEGPIWLYQDRADWPSEIPIVNEDEIDRNSLTRSARNQQKLREHLRRRFRPEYLGQPKVFVKKKANLPIKLGEVVLVENDNIKRVEWPMGRVIELIPGPNGDTRLVRIKTVRGELLRAVQRLVPLECTSKTPAADSTCITDEDAGASEPLKPQQEVLPDRRYHSYQGNEESDDSAGVYVSKSRAPVKNVSLTRSGREVKMPNRYLD